MSESVNFILDKIGEVAERHNIKAYLVGGAVRDALIQGTFSGWRVDFLGAGVLGIDITVEGNGIEFGKLLQAEFGGSLRTHAEFGTVSLILKDRVIDIASCREEKYTAPAKLPEVIRLGRIREDLVRRDFTINTLAIDLVTGELIDLFDGQKDLVRKLIRVLHQSSFVDDPTRIFRALRFAGKLCFKLEPQTEALALSAIKGGLILSLSPKRIRDQLNLILKEPARYKILTLMEEFGILKVLGLKLPERALFLNIDKNLKLAKVNAQWFVYLLGLIPLSNGFKFFAPPKLLALTKSELHKFKHVARLNESVSVLKRTLKPSQVYKLLEGTSVESLLFILALHPELRGKVLKYLQVYKGVKLKISGKDLVWLGVPKGPLYKELLSLTLYAKIDGKVRTKNEELNFVKSLLHD